MNNPVFEINAKIPLFYPLWSKEGNYEGRFGKKGRGGVGYEARQSGRGIPGSVFQRLHGWAAG
jgi:hypothetical protein